MAVSKAQQKAVNKYVREKYDKLLLTMPKGRKDIIKARAESKGESVNAFINRAIDETMEGTPHKTPQEGFETGGAILTPEALKTAQEAAQEAGETVPAFICRAVEVQAKRDKLLHGMKKAGE